MLIRFSILVFLFVFTHPILAQVCRVNDTQGNAIKESTIRWDTSVNHSSIAQSTFPKHIGLAFHIIHTGGEENVSLDAIRTQVDVLNDAFMGTEFSFYLALVTRTKNEAWFPLSNEGVPSATIRDALSVDPDHIINVFVGDMQNEAIGWSVFTDSPDPQSHAIVLDFVALPGGPFDPDFDSGIALAHEMGHYFSLRHPYERGCLPDPTKGDFVGDTPPASNSWFRQCPAVADSCPTLPGNDPVMNYMYATTDACRTTWTPGQIDRMQAKVTEFRPDIGGQDIHLPSDVTIDAHSEWYFYAGSYQFPAESQLTVHGTLYAEDVVFTSNESHWKGLFFSEGSEGYLKDVEIAKVGDVTGQAAITLLNASATLDSVRIEILPESTAEAIHTSGPQSTLYLYQSYIIQQANQASIRASDASRIYFSQDSSATYAGLNRIAGGKLYATGGGVIHAGSGQFDRSHNHFCDANSSQIETSEGGIIYASYNYWYNNASPSLSGSNIFFDTPLGASDCTDSPVVNVQVEREVPSVREVYQLRNQPNPFSGITTISFQLPTSGNVQLILYDMLGRPVKTLVNEFKASGSYDIPLDASELPSGAYISRLVTAQGATTRLISVVK